jgi:hypothetical protein
MLSSGGQWLCFETLDQPENVPLRTLQPIIQKYKFIKKVITSNLGQSQLEEQALFETKVRKLSIGKQHV